MPPTRLGIVPGVDHFPGIFDRAAQENLRDEIGAILAEAPLFLPCLLYTSPSPRDA